MVDQLIYFIARDAPWLNQVFEPPFHTSAGWLNALANRLGGGASGVCARLAREPGTAEPFQTLFIACWIHRPVEKGSYMIPIPNNLLDGVGRAVNALPTRWSSHLSEANARSAGTNYNFLKGYQELLVQVETDRVTRTPYLFLKSEGHGAMSFAHISSFIQKVRTGAGNTQSEALHRLAELPDWGITARAAENFSKGYEGLLSNVGIKGKVVDAAQAIPAICNKLSQKVPLQNASIWNQWLARRAMAPDRAPSNLGLATLVDSVILPTLDQAQGVEGKHLKALRKAREDLREIARALRDDAQGIEDVYVPRFFGEIRVTLDALDQSVRALSAKMTAQVDEVRVARSRSLGFDS
jgi:hypothetical protein